MSREVQVRRVAREDADLEAADHRVLQRHLRAAVDENPDAGVRIRVGAIGSAGENRAVEIDGDVLAADGDGWSGRDRLLQQVGRCRAEW